MTDIDSARWIRHFRHLCDVTDTQQWRSAASKAINKANGRPALNLGVAPYIQKGAITFSRNTATTVAKKSKWSR